MAEKKQESFTVTDRRLFTSEGEIRQEVSQEEVSSTAAHPAARTGRPTRPCSATAESDAPPAPTAAEQKEQADAYRKSAKDLDARVELSGHSTKELEMTFERFMASLYMSAMLQIGTHARTRRAATSRPDWGAPDHRHAQPSLGENQRQPHQHRGKFPAKLSVRTSHGLR